MGGFLSNHLPLRAGSVVRSDQVAQLTLKTSKDGDHTTSLGKLLQCPTVLTGKKVPLYTQSESLNSCLPFLILLAYIAVSLMPLFQVRESCEVCWGHLISWLDKPDKPLLFSYLTLLQPPTVLVSIHQIYSILLVSFPYWWVGAKLNAVFYMWSSKCYIEGTIISLDCWLLTCLYSPVFGHLCFQGTLQSHVQLIAHQVAQDVSRAFF